MTNNNVVVQIPCLNEESTIGDVVRGFRKILPKAKVIVYDNNSIDNSLLFIEEISDNKLICIRNEFNMKGRIVGKIFSLPILNIIFNGQINTTKNYLDSFIKNQAIVYKNSQNVQNLISKFKFKNTTDFGCVQSFEYLNKNYSCHYLNMAYRVNNLSKNFDFKNIKSYFEIGGGFGSNIHFLITNFPNIKKILYLDIVPNIYVGTEYLRHHYKEKVKNAYVPRIQERIKEASGNIIAEIEEVVDTFILLNCNKY